MVWELRNGHKYYYKSVRQGATVKKYYVGRGALADFASEVDDQARARRKTESEAIREYEARLAIPEQLLDELESACETLAHAVLLSLNYHKHRGEWRRRRHVTPYRRPEA